MVTPSDPVEHRRAQLRRAKQRAREAQKSAGLVPCQFVVPASTSRALLEAVRRRSVLDRLVDWLAAEVVDLDAWPQLRLIAWSRSDRWVSGADALALYERNWRHVDRTTLTPDEAALIEALTVRHGHGVMNV